MKRFLLLLPTRIHLITSGEKHKHLHITMACGPCAKNGSKLCDCQSSVSRRFDRFCWRLLCRSNHIKGFVDQSADLQGFFHRWSVGWSPDDWPTVGRLFDEKFPRSLSVNNRATVGRPSVDVSNDFYVESTKLKVSLIDPPIFRDFVIDEASGDCRPMIDQKSPRSSSVIRSTITRRAIDDMILKYQRTVGRQPPDIENLITDEGSISEMRIWFILLIQFDFKIVYQSYK